MYPINETVQPPYSQKQNYNVLPPNSFSTLVYICERFIYLQDPSVYFAAAAKYVNQAWEYINRSQTHECGNGD
jgi:hypothetical protein